MDLVEYKGLVDRIAFGKRTGSALYAYRGDGVKLEEPVEVLVRQVGERCGAGAEFNVIKFRMDGAPRPFAATSGGWI